MTFAVWKVYFVAFTLHSAFFYNYLDFGANLGNWKA